MLILPTASILRLPPAPTFILIPCSQYAPHCYIPYSPRLPSMYDTYSTVKKLDETGNSMPTVQHGKTQIRISNRKYTYHRCFQYISGGVQQRQATTTMKENGRKKGIGLTAYGRTTGYRTEVPPQRHHSASYSHRLFHEYWMSTSTFTIRHILYHICS